MTPPSRPAAEVRWLLDQWRLLAEELAWPEAPAGDVAADLLTRYDEPHRHYHTLVHLRAVLEVLDELAAPASPAPAVRAAAWFHDAVYEGRAGEDEERSAELAHSQLTRLGTPPAITDAVVEMVRATAAHFAPDAHHDPDTEVLLDADLAILGADPDTYDRYAEAVREEYAQVPDDRFRAGRAAVLEALLARPRLFFTDRAEARFEQAARTNLTRELAGLRGSR